MSIVVSDEGNGYTSSIFTGTVVGPGERKQAVSKKTGKYSEFVELTVQFRQKKNADDTSCYVTLRLYSQRNADLALRMSRGKSVMGIVTIDTDRIRDWQRNGTKLFGLASLLLPLGDLIDMISEHLDRKKYSANLEKYRPDPKKINYYGNEDNTGRDVEF